MAAEGQPFHVALYCQDILKFAETFLDRTQIGVARVAPKIPWCFVARWPSPAQYRGWQPEDPGPKFLHAGVRHGEGDAGERRGPILGVIWPDPSQWWSGLGAVPWPWDSPIFKVRLSSWPRFPQCVGYCRRWWLVLRVDLQGRTGGTGPLRHPYLDPAGRSRTNDHV